MPVFVYTARGKDGKVQKGTLEEQSKEAALNTLMMRGLLVTSIQESKIPQKTSTLSQGRLGHQRKGHLHLNITAEDMVMFSRQLGTLLEAGVTLLKSLNILMTHVESKKLLKVLENVKKEVEAGRTLRSAMEKHPKVFSNFWLNLVETGEASGHLARSLNQIALFLENSGRVKQKVVSAMVYPCILIAVSIAAILIFATRIIPIFAGILLSFNIELPTLTKGVIFFSKVLTNYLLYGVVTFVISVVVMVRFIKTPLGKFFFDRLILKTPLIGDLVEMISCERFSGSLSTLLESGVSILHALDIVGKTMDNRVYQMSIEQIKEQVREGKSLSVPLQECGVFPAMLVQMVAVGEEVGELGKMLQRVSSFYQERIDVIISRVTALIEPIILVTMGGVVGVLVISMFLPMFKLSQISAG